MELSITLVLTYSSISTSAFVHLHKSRLKLNSPFLFTEQDRIESSKAIETMLRVISDFFENFLLQNPNFDINENSSFSHDLDNGIVSDTFPYFIHMSYVLLLEMREHRDMSQSPSELYKIEAESHSSSESAFERESTALRNILQYSAKRWQISRKYTHFPLP